MEFVGEALGLLEKAQTLLSSRRLWLTVAEAALAIIAIVALIAPNIGVDVDTENLPDDEALADRLMAWVQSVVALVGGLVVILREIANFASLREGYITRPPGFDVPKE